MSDPSTEYSIQENLIYFTTDFYEMIESNDPSGDALRVFIHLMWTARRQGSRAVWANARYLQNGLKMSEDRVKRAKAMLKKLGLVEYKPQREGQRIVKWFVIINVQMNRQVSTGVVSTPVQDVVGSETPPEFKKENKDNGDKENKEVFTASAMPFLTQPSSSEEQPEKKESASGLIASAKFPKPSKQDRDRRVKHLIGRFAAKFKERKGFDPTINGGAWGAVFKRLLRDSDEETIGVVMDTFFEYDKRTQFSIYDFERRYDAVYGYLYDMKHKKETASG